MYFFRYISSTGQYMEAFTTEALMEVGDKPINKILSKKVLVKNLDLVIFIII